MEKGKRVTVTGVYVGHEMVPASAYAQRKFGAEWDSALDHLVETEQGTIVTRSAAAWAWYVSRGETVTLRGTVEGVENGRVRLSRPKRVGWVEPVQEPCCDRQGSECDCDPF